MLQLYYAESAKKPVLPNHLQIQLLILYTRHVQIVAPNNMPVVIPLSSNQHLFSNLSIITVSSSTIYLIYNLLTRVDDLYDVSDDDVANLAADIGRFEMEEVEVFNGPVPEEAPLGDDPIFLYSQLQSREFRNHDEIQRRLQANEETSGWFLKG